MAISVSVDTVSFNPGKVKYSNGKKVENELLATEFSELFGLDYQETLNKIQSDSSVVVIARKVETDIVKKLKDWMDENKITSGINIDEDFKRYYPNGSLASTLIGFCGTDNTGLTGIEERWNDKLVGTTGRLTVTSDVNGDAISDENEEYKPPENGSNIYLTIDSTVQAIAERHLKEAVEENSADYGGVILMNPQNGDILAMANYPDYDLNDPQNPIYTGLSDSWDTLTSEEKSNARYNIWTNKNVSALYEPGSTFKTIVSAIALEEGLVQTATEKDFFCSGNQEVQGLEKGIACWSPYAHGYQTLTNALEHSCNPAFIQLGQRIGIRTLYKYFDAFGLFDRCGNDIAATPSSKFTPIDKVGSVELATTSFGQRFSITPLQLITAVSTIANGGTLIEPRIVKQIEDTDTKSIVTTDVNTIRSVISKKTSNQVKEMMLSVVENGTGGRTKVTGYEVGGKSGTSEPTVGNESAGYVASFIAITPIENTQVVCLVIVYNPKSASGHQGGTICAPVAGSILSEVLPYINITGTTTVATTDNSDSVKNNSKPVIDAKNMMVSTAREKLESTGFTVVANVEDENSSIVTDQMPKPGAYLEAGATIYLYTSENEVRTSVNVPDVKNKSLNDAINILKSSNLNVVVDGTKGIVTSQSITSGTPVSEGTVVTITVKENANGGQ